MNTIRNTMPVVTMVSLRVGQVTRASSWRTCWTNSAALVLAMAGQINLLGGGWGARQSLYTHGTAGLDAAPPRRGRSGGARPPNPRFWRPVLYQLSYTP